MIKKNPDYYRCLDGHSYSIHIVEHWNIDTIMLYNFFIQRKRGRWIQNEFLDYGGDDDYITEERLYTNIWELQKKKYNDNHMKHALGAQNCEWKCII